MIDVDNLGEIRITCKGADTVPLDSLIPFQGDLKTLSELNLAKLKASILKYGFTAPCFIWEHDGMKSILDAHQRITALKSLRDEGYSIPHIPVDYIDADDEKEAKEKLLHISSQYGEFTQEGIANFVLDAGLDISDLDIRLTNDELTIDDSNEQEDTDGDDEVPDEADPITKLGDLWTLGNHRVLCGDSTDADTVERLMEGAVPHVHVVDPPYETEDLYNVIPMADSSKLMVFWDFKRFATAAVKATEKNWVAQYEFIWDCVTSWYTPNRPLARHKACGIFSEDPKFNFEKAIIHDGKKRESKIVHNTRGKSNYTPLSGAVHIRTVEAFPTTQENSEHAHSKPVKWIEGIMNGIGGAIYLDYFLGSGTSVIVCEKTDRICYGLELDPHYCDVIRDRYIEWCNNNGRTRSVTLNGKPY